MTEARLHTILRQLRTRDSHVAWSAFIDEYAPLIFEVVRRFERDPDHAADCFQFVCERLCEGRFRRLLKFTPHGPAKFSTWLRAVVRNLCLDRRRKEFGRRRMFRSIARLSEVDQQIFQLVYERGLSEAEALSFLTETFPHLTSQLISEGIVRINNSLSANQAWLLNQRDSIAGGSALPDNSAIEMQDIAPDPEARAMFAEQRRILQRAIMRLPAREKLLIRLRYEEGLTLDQIARLLELGNAQRADRKIKEILFLLRREFESPATVVGGKNSTSSVKVS